MKVRNAIKRVKSHFAKQGIDIEVNVVGYKWAFEHNGYVGSFSANGYQPSDPEALDADATLFHVRRANDYSDPHTDYYAGSFRDNISQVCKSLLPNPPKFPVGTLVRGKQTKRATRWFINGKVGLVISASDGYAKVQWTGEQHPAATYSPSYSERDLERV